MTREERLTGEELSEMAEQSGLFLTVGTSLSRFAALVAAAEREACATLALNQKNNVNIYHRLVYNLACQDILDAICARGQE